VGAPGRVTAWRGTGRLYSRLRVRHSQSRESRGSADDNVILVELLGGGVKCGEGRARALLQLYARAGEGCNPGSVKLQKTESKHPPDRRWLLTQAPPRRPLQACGPLSTHAQAASITGTCTGWLRSPRLPPSSLVPSTHGVGWLVQGSAHLPPPSRRQWAAAPFNCRRKGRCRHF
jgi:hypothetical protein